MGFEKHTEYFKKPERGPHGYELEDIDSLDLRTTDYLLIDDEPVRVTRVSKIGDVSYALEKGNPGNISRDSTISIIRREK